MARRMLPHGMEGDAAHDNYVLRTVSGIPVWLPVHEVPAGGTSGQVLTKASAVDWATTWSTPATGGGGGGGGTVYDRRWAVGSTETTIDEFNDNSLAAAWTRVDGTGAASGNCAWTEGGDSLSLKHNGGDSAGVAHGLVTALTGAGGSLVTGDAFVSCITLLAPSANFSSIGLCLSDGTTHGAGKQVVANMGFSVGAAVLAGEVWSNWNSRTSTVTTMSPQFANRWYQRIVMTAANTWRVDISADGVSWHAGTTMSQTFTPTHVGFYTTSWGGAVKFLAGIEFIRRASGVS